MPDKGFPLDIEVIDVRFFHPASESRIREIEPRTLHRINAHALLTCVTPFFARDLRLENGIGHNDHEKFNALQSFLNLTPPTDSALDLLTILPHGDVRRVLLETLAQLVREALRAYEIKTPDLPIIRYSWAKAYVFLKSNRKPQTA